MPNKVATTTSFPDDMLALNPFPAFVPPYPGTMLPATASLALRHDNFAAISGITTGLSPAAVRFLTVPEGPNMISTGHDRLPI